MIFSNFYIDCKWQKESHILTPLGTLERTDFGGGYAVTYYVNQQSQS